MSKTLEDEFLKIVNEHKDEIQAKLKEASAALSAAVDLAEKYGVPFYSNISFLSQSYTPTSYYEKFPELERDVVGDLIDVYPGGEWGGDGWEHSAVC